jgi:hypothetical protein
LEFCRRHNLLMEHAGSIHRFGLDAIIKRYH